MEVVATLFQSRTAAAQCGLFTHKSVPVIFEPPCTFLLLDKEANILFLLSFSAVTNLIDPEHEGNDIFQTSVTILQ